MPKEAPVHCIIQCQRRRRRRRRRRRSFPSTVLYSGRGRSGASRPLYYTVPEEDFPSTALYSARGGFGASLPLYYTVPEEGPKLPDHCSIQCQSFPPTVLYSAASRAPSSRAATAAAAAANQHLNATLRHPSPSARGAMISNLKPGAAPYSRAPVV